MMDGTLTNRVARAVVVLRDRRARRLARTRSEDRVERRYDRVLRSKVRLVESLRDDPVIADDYRVEEA